MVYEGLYKHNFYRQWYTLKQIKIIVNLVAIHLKCLEDETKLNRFRSHILDISNSAQDISPGSLNSTIDESFDVLK